MALDLNGDLVVSRRDGLTRNASRRLYAKAYGRALRDLRNKHRPEFDHLHAIRMEEIGLYPDRIDLELALSALNERITNPRNRNGRPR